MCVRNLMLFCVTRNCSRTCHTHRDKINIFYFFPSGHGNKSCNLIGHSNHGHNNTCMSFSLWDIFCLRAWKKINNLFTSVEPVPTCHTHSRDKINTGIFYFFPSGHGNKSYNLIGHSNRSHSNSWMSFFCEIFFRLRAWKKIIKLFTGIGSVCIVKNCDLGRPQAAFWWPLLQFFTM